MHVNPVSSSSASATSSDYADRLRAALAEKAAQRNAPGTDADGDNDGSTSAHDQH